MRLEVNGVEFENFLSAQVQIRLDSLCRAFSFTAVSTRGDPLPFSGGESCRVIVDGEAVLTGHIEIVDADYDKESHTITVEGRDKLGDLVDSSLLAIDDIRSPITLKQIVERIISALGLDIIVIDEANPEPFNESEDIASPEPGQNAFEFLEAIARKRQVFLTSNGAGNLVILKSPGADSGYLLQNIIDANDNNILSGSVSYDNTGIFNKYTMSSSMNPVALNSAGDTDIASIVNQSGSATGSARLSGRVGRQLVLVSEGSFSNDEDGKRADWEKRIREARSRVHSVSVQEYRPENDLWAVNTTVGIVDEFAKINERMLINSVTFSQDADSGSLTNLSLIEENAYNLELAEPVVQGFGF